MNEIELKREEIRESFGIYLKAFCNLDILLLGSLKDFSLIRLGHWDLGHGTLSRNFSEKRVTLKSATNSPAG